MVDTTWHAVNVQEWLKEPLPHIHVLMDIQLRPEFIGTRFSFHQIHIMVDASMKK